MEHFRTEMVPDPVPISEKRSGPLRFVIDLVETVALSIILFLVINAVSARIRVDGFSMEPTLQSGEFVVVNKLAYRFAEPARGDVVVFHFPRNPDQEYIKRVIGLPGDRISVADGTVFINGFPLDEPYVKSPPAYENEWVVSESGLFVLGDNRNNSSDSHNWGEVPLELIVGVMNR